MQTNRHLHSEATKRGIAAVKGLTTRQRIQRLQMQREEAERKIAKLSAQIKKELAIFEEGN